MYKLIIAAILLSGCSSTPSLVKMSGAGYRVTGCFGENKMQCSRMMRQVCPEGLIVLNPGTAESKGPIFMCAATE